MKNSLARFCIAAAFLIAGLVLLWSGNQMLKPTSAHAKSEPATQPATQSTTSPDAATKLPITFTGGYDTDPQDRGRPVILIAAALNVPAETFRKAFSNVTPAAGGREPDPAQVRKNKDALLKALEPLGVTNDRLDEVSNYYRYNRGKGEMWKTTPAAATATLRNGILTEITITNPGAGYSSPPKVSIPSMPKINLTATLSFTTDLAKNGSIKEITITPAEKPRTP